MTRATCVIMEEVLPIFYQGSWVSVVCLLGPELPLHSLDAHGRFSVLARDVSHLHQGLDVLSGSSARWAILQFLSNFCLFL